MYLLFCYIYEKYKIMSIARLDNEVFFKKAFTDEFVFKAFVKDIVGIDEIGRAHV